jgi:hypothetical protein
MMKEKKKYAGSLHRSAIAPDTMVTHEDANAVARNIAAIFSGSFSSRLSRSQPCRRAPAVRV